MTTATGFILGAATWAAISSCRTDAPLPPHPYPTSLPTAQSRPARPVPLEHASVKLEDAAAGLVYGEPEERAIRDVPLADPKSYRSPAAANIVVSAGKVLLLEVEVATALEDVARELPPGIGLFVVEGYRTLEQQTALIRQSCENPPGYKTCSPRPGYPPACMLRLGDRHSCPHTTGRAVDLFAMIRSDDGWLQCVTQQQCLTANYDLASSIDACVTDPCVAKVAAAMRARGFCASAGRPWHFELPQLSSECR